MKTAICLYLLLSVGEVAFSSDAMNVIYSQSNSKRDTIIGLAVDLEGGAKLPLQIIVFDSGNKLGNDNSRELKVCSHEDGGVDGELNYKILTTEEFNLKKYSNLAPYIIEVTPPSVEAGVYLEIKEINPVEGSDTLRLKIR